jgi:flagellar biosynthesis protein FlhF
MKIKSYFSHTVEDAMAMARQELGPDAMLVNSRAAGPEARHLGEYEVVFVTETSPPDTPGASVEFSSASAAARNPFSEKLALEVADLKQELENMRRALTRQAFAPPAWMETLPDLSDAYSLLTASEVAPELVREVVQSARSRLAGPRLDIAQPPDAAQWQRAVEAELESRFTVEPFLGRGDARPRMVALVGPPGCGKTTTLVKLAVTYGLASRRPVLLFSVDTCRVAAAEQLRSYASILGVGFQVLETLAALSQAIEENRGKDLILIDTPGFGFGDLESAANLAQFLSTRPEIDTQLVLPASMKPADLTRVAQSFEIFRPQRLLFTKLDETGSFGPILNEAARTGKALSFLATGQRIPEDLEAASQRRLVELILAGEPGRARETA